MSEFIGIQWEEKRKQERNKRIRVRSKKALIKVYKKSSPIIDKALKAHPLKKFKSGKLTKGASKKIRPVVSSTYFDKLLRGF